MMFDIALAFRKRSQIKEAVRAIAAEDWGALAAQLEGGLSPNQRLPVSDLPAISRQGPKSTTPFLAMSTHRMDNPPDTPQQEALIYAFVTALERGADLSARAEGDARSAIDHQANIRSLGGWQAICALRPVDFREMIARARSLDWDEGEEFARHAQSQAQSSDMDQATPPCNPLPAPRL